MPPVTILFTLLHRTFIFKGFLMQRGRSTSRCLLSVCILLLLLV